MLHNHKFYVPLKRTRKQILKDLMRYRTTEDQGLTLKQIFFEVYSDFVEKYTTTATTNQESYDYLDDRSYYAKISYIRRMIRQVKRTDNDFRWLSVLPVKISKIDPITGNKVGKSYIEHRYINVKASKTPELLEEIDEIWRNRTRKRHETIQKRAYFLERYFEEITMKEEEEEEEKRKAVEKYKKEESFDILDVDFGLENIAAVVHSKRKFTRAT
jgi:hypothetical protein